MSNYAALLASLWTVVGELRPPILRTEETGILQVALTARASSPTGCSLSVSYSPSGAWYPVGVMVQRFCRRYPSAVTEIRNPAINQIKTASPSLCRPSPGISAKLLLLLCLPAATIVGCESQPNPKPIPVTDQQKSSDARAVATSEQVAQMARLSDTSLLSRADRLLAGKNAREIPLEAEDQAAMYVREFDRRHPDSSDKHLKRTGERLASVTLARNLAERAAMLDAKPPRDEAQVICRMTVKRNLKAPSTADFQSYVDDYVKYLGHGKFHIQTQADSQNSFGATLRSTFDC